MEVSHFGVAHFNAEGVSAIFGGAEVDRHLTFVGATHHSEVFIVLGEINLGIVGVELELGQLAAIVEADDSAVDDQALRLADVEVDATLLGGLLRTYRKYAYGTTTTCQNKRDDVAIVFGHNEYTFHG